MYDVITIGSSTVDVFGTSPKKFKDIKVGDKVLIDFLDFEIGGGAINSAAALSRMGFKISTLCKLGNDHNAEKIVKELEKDNIDILTEKRSKKPTSYSYILNTKGEDRIIFQFKGASDDLRWDEIDKDKLKNTKFIYMATMLGESFSTCEKIAEFCTKNNIALLFNPSKYLAAKGKKGLKKILENTSIIVLNKEEARTLLNTKKRELKFLMTSIRKLGPKIVVVTEGKKGVNVLQDGAIFHMDPYDVKVLHTAGAGDAFTSGFLAGILMHNDIPVSIKLGNANAASVIQHYGAHSKLLTYKQAFDFIVNNKSEVIIKRI